MNKLIFDTETISLTKPFIYNLGYVVVNEKYEVIAQRDFVIKQIYDNKPMFNTAYYANKRPLYTSKMKGKRAQKVTWGKACQEMTKDIITYNITNVYAYNSDFDTKAFYFTHAFYKNKTRPLDRVFINDIMDYIKPITDTSEYKDFCMNNGFTTKHKPPRAKQTAESMYAFLTQNANYKEEHTALEDSKIEMFILQKCEEKTKE